MCQSMARLRNDVEQLISLLEFRKTGISPLNVHAFSDGDFSSAFVTDRPLRYDCSSAECEEQRRPLNLNNNSVSSTSGFRPEIVHTFTKASKRNENPRRRLKRRKTAILTNTIEEEKRSTDEKRKNCVDVVQPMSPNPPQNRPSTSTLWISSIRQSIDVIQIRVTNRDGPPFPSPSAQSEEFKCP
ncbi:hypothetical protein PR048_029290 [Dryococelus australis]|uniref:Uncharacterized protein n=1 Tax=Dryococelus australis TaxID=614101 RepID=A0ABQ9GG09_9NEOP|nr:hypothetical protein PR048_029290 [Dryococelus australis]